METLKAGEFGRDLEDVRGDALRRIDCSMGFAIVLAGGRLRRRQEEEEEEEEEMDCAYTRSLNIEMSYFRVSRRIIPWRKLTKIMFERGLGIGILQWR
jgi:hypothetical protein